MERKQHWSKFDLSGLTSAQRDDLIVKLRAEGLTFRQIADRVGMTHRGVQYALERITEGRPGRDPRR
jgi:hypothetical protein